MIGWGVVKLHGLVGRGSPISRHVMFLAFARASGQGVILLLFADLARSLGVDLFGRFILSFSIATALSGVIDFGAGMYWIREYSSGRLSSSALRRRSGGKIISGATVAAFLCVIALFGFYTELLVFAAGLLFASVLSQTHQVLLVAAKENSRLSAYTLVERSTLCLSYFSLTRLASVDPKAAFVVCYLVSAMLMSLMSVRRVPTIRPDYVKFSLSETWRGTAYYGISTSLISLQSLDVVLGSAIGGAAVAGRYGAVAKWTMPIALATNAFATILNPIAAAAKNREDLWRKVRASLWLPASSILVAVFMGVFAERIVLVVLGPSFIGSVVILRWLAVAAAMSTCSQVAFTILQSRRREKFVARSIGMAVGSQLLLVSPLVGLWGASGLAIASVGGQGVLLVLLIWKVLVLAYRG